MSTKRSIQCPVVTILTAICVMAFSSGYSFAQCCGTKISPRRTSDTIVGGPYLPGPLGVKSDAIPFADNGVTEQGVEELLNKFRSVFPKISFSQDWDDSTVNAIAFGSPDGQRNVVIFGGMLKHPMMGMEGISIILAHEVGHHYGNTDEVKVNATIDSLNRRYDHGAFCEDQSDFWGTRVGLRLIYNTYENTVFNNAINAFDEDSINTLDWEAFSNVVDSEDYLDVATKGIEQTNALLGGSAAFPDGGLAQNYDDWLMGREYGKLWEAGDHGGDHVGPILSFADAAFCGHPIANCRKQLYTAGMNKAKRPHCSITPFSRNNFNSFEPTTIASYKARQRVDFTTGDTTDLLRALTKEIQELKKELAEMKAKMDQ